MSTVFHPLSERDHWVDFAKGFGIVLVAYAHVARGLVNAGLMPATGWGITLDHVIYSFHMPLFFVLAGTHFRSSLFTHGPRKLALRRIDALFYPYVLWSLVQGAIEWGMGRFTNSQVTWAEILSLLWQPRAHFWFLFALLWVVLLCIVLYKRVPRQRQAWLLAFAVVFYLAQPWVAELPVLGFVSAYLVWFVAGIWVQDFEPWLMAWARRAWWPLTGAVVLAQWVFHGPMGLTYQTFGVPTLIVAAVSAGWLMLGCMALDQQGHKRLARLGNGSMAIYVWHILTASGVRIVLQKLLHIDNLAVHLVVGLMCALYLPYLLDQFLMRIRWPYAFKPPGLLSFEERFWVERRRRAR